MPAPQDWRVMVDRVIDVNAINAIGDYEDYVHVEFGIPCQPSHLYLRGARAEAFREWLHSLHGCNDKDEGRSLCHRLSPDEIARLERKVKRGEPLSQHESSSLIRALKVMTLDRDSIVQSESTGQSLFWRAVREMPERVLSAAASRPVKCVYAEDCEVAVDASCAHTQEVESSVCWFWAFPDEWNLD